MPFPQIGFVFTLTGRIIERFWRRFVLPGNAKIGALQNEAVVVSRMALGRYDGILEFIIA